MIYLKKIKDHDVYVDACKKHGFKILNNEEFIKFSDLVSRAIWTQDGKNALLNILNDKYLNSSFGKMNEALK